MTEMGFEGALAPRALATAPQRRRSKGRPVWDEPPTKAGQFGKSTVIAVVLALVLVPLYTIILTSLSDEGTINAAGGLVLLPHGLTFDAYRQVFENGTVTRALEVTFGITVVGTAFSMVVSVLCAYGLSRSRSFGHRPVLLLLIITMFVNGGLIPSFIVVTELGGFDQYWALILPSAVNVFNILVLRSFFSGTAVDLIDAARLDGAGEWRILWSVVMPTSRAVLAVITLFYAVGYWNTWFSAVLYMPIDQQKWPIQNVLYEYVNRGMTMPGVANSGYGGIHQQTTPLSLSMAVVVLTLLPIVVVYPFVQKHFAKGMLTGAIKG